MPVEIEYVDGTVYNADQSVKETVNPYHRFCSCTFLRNLVFIRAHPCFIFGTVIAF
jgi:hypothetical protein